MQNKLLTPLLSAALFATAGFGSAATIVDNNTGLLTSTFSFLNFETGFGGSVPGVGTITNNTSSGGGEGPGNAFGDNAGWSGAGNMTYSFTELVAGQQYQIYANWYGNGTANCAIDVTANGVNVGAFTFAQTVSSSAGATGFTAYQEGSTDLSTAPFGFTLLGTGIADANGDLIIVSSKSTTTSFGRYDAFAVAPVAAIPEPSIALLGGLGLLGILRRRR